MQDKHSPNVYRGQEVTCSDLDKAIKHSSGSSIKTRDRTENDSSLCGQVVVERFRLLFIEMEE